MSFPQEGLIVSSKSFDQIERAMEIIEGDLENLVESGSEIMLSEQPGFFFLATVDGLGSIRGVPTLPGKFALRDGHSRAGDSNQSRLCERVSGLACLFELVQILIRKGRKLYASDRYIVEIDEIVYAIDASTIDLCMSLLPWARFRNGNLPSSSIP